MFLALAIGMTFWNNAPRVYCNDLKVKKKQVYLLELKKKDYDYVESSLFKSLLHCASMLGITSVILYSTAARFQIHTKLCSLCKWLYLMTNNETNILLKQKKGNKIHNNIYKEIINIHKPWESQIVIGQHLNLCKQCCQMFLANCFITDHK